MITEVNKKLTEKEVNALLEKVEPAPNTFLFLR